MRSDLIHLAAELGREGRRYVLASVVRREAPSSAHLGDAALITEDGAFHGWLGGSCTRSTVVREALQAMREERPRLIALSPEPGRETRPGVTALLMTCHSGGSVDIYLQPVLPAPRLLVFGVSPMARAVASMGKVLGYEVWAVNPEANADDFPDADRVVAALDGTGAGSAGSPAGPRTSVVVATMGEGDEAAIREALSAGPAYLGLLASRKRFGEVRRRLIEQGVAERRLESIRCPAGLDLGAVTPAEIALSIMAEIVQLDRRQSGEATGEPEAPSRPESKTGSTGDGSGGRRAQRTTATDPVCGMTVDPLTARHRAEVAGSEFYFCCGGCRDAFLVSPERYLTGTAAGGAGAAS